MSPLSLEVEQRAPQAEPAGVLAAKAACVGAVFAARPRARSHSVLWASRAWFLRRDRRNGLCQPPSFAIKEKAQAFLCSYTITVFMGFLTVTNISGVFLGFVGVCDFNH